MRLSVIRPLLIHAVVTLPALIIFLLSAYSANFQYQRPVPEMTRDVFGYTNMAKAIRAGKLFTGTTPRPYLDELLDDLRAKGLKFEEYYETVAPFSYHLDDLSNKIINQYPPGTALLLSLLPLQYRPYGFPVLVLLLFFLVSIIAIRALTGRLSWFFTNTVLFLMFLMVLMPPPLFNLHDVNSYSPTFGFLLAVGLALVLKPKWAFLPLGAAALFRVSNIIFAPPVFVIWFYLLRERSGSWAMDRQFAGDFGRMTLWALALFLLGGYGLNLVYVWWLTGNPFHLIYPYYDREFADLVHLVSNLRYLSPTSPFLLFDLLVLGLVGVLTFKKSKKWLVFAVSIFVLNYLFFICHQVYVMYYVYGSAYINLGVALAHLYLKYSQLDEKKRTGINYAGSALVFTCLAVALIRIELPRESPGELYKEKLNSYERVFADYDVVWAHLRGGAIEYLLDKPTLNYNDGSQAAKDEILMWMHNHGYRQVIWLNDIDIDSRLDQEILPVMWRLKLPYRIRPVDRDYFGYFLEIDTKQGE